MVLPLGVPRSQRTPGEVTIDRSWDQEHEGGDRAMNSACNCEEGPRERASPPPDVAEPFGVAMELLQAAHRRATLRRRALGGSRSGDIPARWPSRRNSFPRPE